MIACLHSESRNFFNFKIFLFKIHFTVQTLQNLILISKSDKREMNKSPTCQQLQRAFLSIKHHLLFQVGPSEKVIKFFNQPYPISHNSSSLFDLMRATLAFLIKFNLLEKEIIHKLDSAECSLFFRKSSQFRLRTRKLRCKIDFPSSSFLL